ncbi:glycosyltransferase family 4 protein [Roseibium suaedae]|uniref:Glycosyltransferase involved in cell wall bisynthesis n=1 Tax=Roseibium suaedae TaxID=735517 RepID=A0A1M6YW15_9HYPH|nr:glycosyltransferase family 4 protein [Roseibium suaedae]SHL22438.1 Glycosyltransferase involved in cell wall bisynthesis [Roseibium suaedae]
MKVGIVLPRGMHFSPQGATSIDIVAHELLSGSRFKTQSYVLGTPVAQPYAGVDFRPVSASGQRLLTAEYIRALKSDRPDVVVVHQHPETAARIARALAPTPVILHRHGLLKEQRSWFSAWRKERLFKSLARIVFVSAFIRERFLSQFPRLSNRCTVVFNGLRTQEWLPAEKKNEIVFVGRARPDKGLLPLLEAYTGLLDHPQAKSWTLKLVLGIQTGAERAFAQSLRDLAASTSRIEFLENLTSHEVKAHLSAAAIAVMPSIVREGFGRAMVEAMACGCATIATNQGGMPEAAGDGALLLDSPEAADFPERLREALLTLMTDTDRRQELAQAGRKHVVSALELEGIVRQYDQMLENTVHQR